MTAEVTAPGRPVELFFSQRLAECEQQAFILSAVGIHSWIADRDGGFAVFVAEESFDVALKHLTEVAQENLAARKPPVVAVVHPHAWLGSLLYALILMTAAYAAGIDLFDKDWFGAGALNGSMPHTHEWWRVFTALTLHTDVAHLIGNLLFGACFGYFAALAVGSGVAWASIVLGAAIGNCLDALWMPESQSSIGASTAVFSTLGLLSTYAWRRAVNVRPVARWAPLVAGIALLAILGVGDEHTDVVAHFAGFVSGGVLGVILGRVRQDSFRYRHVQLGAGALSIAAILGSWAWPLLLR